MGNLYVYVASLLDANCGAQEVALGATPEDAVRGLLKKLIATTGGYSTLMECCHVSGAPERKLMVAAERLNELLGEEDFFPQFSHIAQAPLSTEEPESWFWEPGEGDLPIVGNVAIDVRRDVVEM